jgi:hypothetical protein
MSGLAVTREDWVVITKLTSRLDHTFSDEVEFEWDIAARYEESLKDVLPHDMTGSGYFGSTASNDGEARTRSSKGKRRMGAKQRSKCKEKAAVEGADGQLPPIAQSRPHRAPDRPQPPPPQPAPQLPNFDTERHSSHDTDFSDEESSGRFKSPMQPNAYLLPSSPSNQSEC